MPKQNFVSLINILILGMHLMQTYSSKLDGSRHRGRATQSKLNPFLLLLGKYSWVSSIPKILTSLHLQYMIERYHHSSTGISLFTDLRAVTHFGRPNFVSIFKTLKQKYKQVRKTTLAG